MSKKDRPIKVLFMDDSKESFEALDRVARQDSYRIILHHAENLEDAIAKVKGKEGKAYSGIILDIIGLITREQDFPDHSSFPLALKTFESIAPDLPKVALTGESNKIEEYKSMFEHTLNVYLKGSDDVKKMLQYLRSESNKLEDNKIRKSHPDVFSVFEKAYLDPDAEQELLNCIKNMNDGDFTNIKDNLARLRRFHESIYIALNKNFKKLVPDTFLINKAHARVDIKGVIGYLRNNEIVRLDSIIDKFTDNCYDVITANGSHIPFAGPDKEVFYKPTKYTVQACTYAMMDLLLWFKGVMQEKQ